MRKIIFSILIVFTFSFFSIYGDTINRRPFLTSNTYLYGICYLDEDLDNDGNPDGLCIRITYDTGNIENRLEFYYFKKDDPDTFMAFKKIIETVITVRLTGIMDPESRLWICAELNSYSNYTNKHKIKFLQVQK